MSYIPDLEKDREEEFGNRFFASPAACIASELLYSGGVSRVALPHAIVGLRIPFGAVLPDWSEKGDIDILLIPLDCENGIAPSFSYMEAIELKYGYLEEYEDNKGVKRERLRLRLRYFLKESKSWKEMTHQEEAREQAPKLCKLGFDRVAVVYGISTIPNTNEKTYRGIQSHFRASERNALAVSKIDRNDIPGGSKIIVKDEDTFGTAALVMGAVPGRTEIESGSMWPRVWKKTPKNPLKNEDSPFRVRLARKIETIWERDITEVPSLPVVVLACSKCKKLYISQEGPGKLCPFCRSKPN